MKSKIIFSLILGATLVTSGVVVDTSSKKAFPVSGWSELEPISATLGEIITIPDITYSAGEIYEATKITTYPDGSEKMGDEIEITMPGQYTITFTVVVDGVVENKVETFFVDYQQISVHNRSASSITYIEDPQAVGINAATPGAYVKLAYGDTLTFTQPVYLTDLVNTNLLTKFYVVPSNMGSVDFSSITLTLTNPDDPNNYAKIIYYSHVETNSNGSVSHSSSVCARSDAVNVFAGIHQSQGLHTNDKYGLWSGCTFDGYVQESYGSDKIDTCMFVFGFDATTNQALGTGFNLGRTGEKVLDLDNPDEVRKVWGGFTSNRVMMSINCDTYSSTTADFVITEILGVSGNDLKNNLFVDLVEPEIKLVKNEKLPSGAVGYYYPIPEAVAYDEISLTVPVDVNVYQNYNDLENRVKVKIENGKFHMANSGLYSIVYEAKDHSGNMARLIKSISVLDEINKPEFDLPSFPSETDIGTYIKLPQDIEILSYCGEATLKTFYQCGTGEKILVSDGFRVETLEEYTIIYEASDMIGQTTTKSCKISSINRGLPILESELSLPKYFISNGIYRVPNIRVCLFIDGEFVFKEATFKVTCDGESKEYESGDEYVPTVKVNNSFVNVQVVYETTVLFSQDVLTIKSTGKDGNENRLDLANYFITDSGKFLLRPNKEKFVDDKEQGAYFYSEGGEDIKTDFANFIFGNNVSITLNKVVGAVKNTKVKVILTDASDLNSQVSASLIYDGVNTVFSVGNNKSICLDNFFNVDNETNTFTLSFDGTNFMLNDGVKFPVMYKEDGKAFNGFLSENVYISLEVSGCSKDTSLLINTICGQLFKSGTTRDVTAPNVYMSNEIGGTFKINDVYHIDSMSSYDVLSPNVVFTLTVKNSNGEYVKDVFGEEMNNVDPTYPHDIVLDQYGAYTFTIITQEDGRFLKYPNSRSYSRSLQVYDDVKPVIVMKEQFQSEVKVGTEVRFPEFTYSDNYDSNEDLIVQRVYIDANGKYHNMLDSENTIKFLYEGTYKIMINVMDTSGNIANVTMYVKVSK